MLCLSWRVTNSLSFLVLLSLLLITESASDENYLGLVKYNVGNILTRQFHEAAPNVNTNHAYDTTIRVKRQRSPFPPPNSPVAPFQSPTGRLDFIPPPFSPHNMRFQPFPSMGRPYRGEHNFDCGISGQRKRGRIPPAHQRGPCRSKIPPGRRRRIWPPPIIDTNNDFKYPSTKLPLIEQKESENVVVYHRKKPVILLRPEEIRK